MVKQTIKNRYNLKIVTQLEKAAKPKGLAIVLHGLSGAKEQEHIKTFCQSFKESNYHVLSFDATNSFNESEGEYKDASVTKHYQDLEDVIAWAKEQDWYIEPFVLCGHSLGGIAVILYAINFPDKVKALAPISALISGKLSLEGKEYFMGKDYIKDWQESGWLECESETRKGLIKRLPWSHMEDRLKYDVIPDAYKLNLPVLIIVGEDDLSVPPKHQKLFFDKLPGSKEMHIIKAAPHTFNEQKQLDEIKQIMKNWLKKI